MVNGATYQESPPPGNAAYNMAPSERPIAMWDGLRNQGRLIKKSMATFPLRMVVSWAQLSPVIQISHLLTSHDRQVCQLRT